MAAFSGRSFDVARSGVARDPAIERIGETGLVGVVERGWATGDLAGRADFFHQVAHTQALADVFLVEFFAARVDDAGAFRNRLRSQRDIVGDDQIAAL